MPEKDMVSEIEEVEVEPAETETFEDEVEEIGSIAADEQPAADTAEQEPETEESQSSAEAAAATDPLEEFKAKLRRQIGDWYVVLRMDEVFDMLLPVFEEEQQSKGLPTPQPVVESDYSVGDNVRVKSGPFEGMDATISEIKPEAQEVVTLISVFERDTPVTLKFSQIEKM